MPDTAPVYVQDHCFFLSDSSAAMVFDDVDYSTGMAGLMESMALICAGVDRGIVTVTVDTAESRPHLDTPQQWAALAEWEDIAEFTLHARNGDLRVDRLEYGPFDARVDLPSLSPFGPGHYRIRIHASGRDLHYDKVVENSDESFYLIAWPEAPAAPLVIKSNSLHGYGLRFGQISKPSRPAPEPSPRDLEAEAHNEMRRRALGG
jgi:hypothetical protein